ncbi:MAG: helix-turn-helix domain-containing protein [Planctomycetota bacterium]|nr:helix-turn-helix domain-containing protein [Planctomycetota bacterium]
MGISTKIRKLARLLEHERATLWCIDQADELVFLSAGCADWLGIDVEDLIGRRSKAGTAVSGEPADLIAASLSPPPGVQTLGTASLKTHPPSFGNHRPESREVRYTRVGEGESGFTIGIAGEFRDRKIESDIQDAVAIRQRLDQWRQRQSGLGSILLMGTSSAAQSLQRRVEVACSIRTHTGLIEPSGGGADVLARHIHQLSASGEPLIQIDGPLMDAELLDSAVMPLLNRLSDSESALGSILCRQLDQTSTATQMRLFSLMESFPKRLRLLATWGSGSATPIETAKGTDLGLNSEERPDPICREIGCLLETIQIPIAKLSDRVEDLHSMAQALLGRHRVTGKITPDRISRPALDAMVHYPWPNNLIELEESIRFASKNSVGEAIQIEDLPLSIRSYQVPLPRNTRRFLPLDVLVRRYEESLIIEAMESANHNRAEAARKLGISRSRLIRKLDHLETDAKIKGRST